MQIRCLAKTRAKQIQPSAGPEKAFGLALREIRRETGMSQERLALDCDLDRTYVSLMERGLKSPTVRTLFTLARILRVRPSELVKRAEALAMESGKPKI
jgi:transcriptional regulator with XRE-family HTH domain